MGIELKRVNSSNWLQCCGLKVAPEQSEFVAPNVFSLAEAAYSREMTPMAIVRDGEIVGFLMWGFDDELCAWNMCRLMVDARYQGQGIGSSAIDALLRLVAAKVGHVAFHTSAEPENDTAIALYEKKGFVKTGCIIEGEVDMVVQL